MAYSKSDGLFAQQDTCVQFNGNFVTAVKGIDVAQATPNLIRDKAVERHVDVFPTLTPDNASTVLAFHTEKGIYTLAAIRRNPDVDESFPEQINGSTGGFLPDNLCSETYIKALLTTLSQKLLLDNEQLIEKLKSTENEVGLAAIARLSQLRETIAKSEGWGSTVAVHAYQGDWKMCVLTAVKHIKCNYADLQQIQQDLALLMPIERQRIIDATPSGTRPNLRTISNFQVFELDPIVANAKQSYLLDEKVKAEKALSEHGDKVIITFNDFAMERLAAHDGFNVPTSGLAQMELEVAQPAKTATGPK